MRPKSLFLILIALGCGLVASIGISQVVERRGDGEPEMQTSPIYVAMAEVNIAEEFTAENIKLEEWPVDKIPDGAVTTAEELDGKCPTTRLYPGEPILLFKIASRSEINSRSDRIKPGYRVMSVRVSLDTGVSNMVRPGDNVDVLVFIADRNNPRTEVVLTNIEVFAVNDQVERTVDADGTTMQAQTVSLLVTPDQAKKLMLFTHIGRLSFSLRSPDDKGDLDVVEADPEPAPEPARMPAMDFGWLEQEPETEKFQMEVIDGDRPSIWVWDDLDQLPRRADSSTTSAPATRPPAVPSGFPFPGEQEPSAGAQPEPMDAEPEPVGPQPTEPQAY